MGSGTAQRRGKRSNGVRLTVMLTAAGSTLLAACGSEDAATSAVTANPIEPGSAEVQAFENVFECKASGELTEEQCAEARQQALAQAEKTAPRYAGQGDCESDWGGGGCVQHAVGGSSFFMPFVGGFLVGKLLQGGRRDSFPLFRKAGEPNFSTANGARLGYGGAPGKYYATARAFEQPRSVPAIKANTGAVARGGMAARTDQEQRGSSRWGRSWGG